MKYVSSNGWIEATASAWPSTPIAASRRAHRPPSARPETHTNASKDRKETFAGFLEHLRANGVKTDLETALFDVDHGIQLPQALLLARAARADRPSIDGDDVLAWALARNGRCTEALPYSERALRLGTRDATKFFHRGMVERCLGHPEAAKKWFRRALALNPHFSLLWAPVAKRYAA